MIGCCGEVEPQFLQHLVLRLVQKGVGILIVGEDNGELLSLVVFGEVTVMVNSKEGPKVGAAPQLA